MEKLEALPAGAYRPEGGTHLVRLLESGEIAFLVGVNSRTSPPTYTRVDTRQELDAIADISQVDWYAVPKP